MRPGWQVDRCSIGVQAASSKMGRNKQHDGETRWGRSSNADKRSKEGEASRATKTVQQQAARWAEASWARWGRNKQQYRQEMQAARRGGMASKTG